MDVIIERLVDVAFTHLGIDKGTVDFELEFVTKDEIKDLNKEFRNKEEVTDVLSFPNLELKRGEIITPKTHPLDVNPETGRVNIGSIAVCMDIAKDQAKEYGHSDEREIAFLTLHGLLHLLGHTHDEVHEREVMESLQEEILAKLGLTR